MGEKKDHRYHLLVIGGVVSHELMMLGRIDIPKTDFHWYVLTKFIKNRVDDYMKKEIDIPFDEYITNALTNRFGIE